jgi:hypothetical protein
MLAVVSFNYDRCFEHFLHRLLMTVYTLPPQETARLVGLVEVYHPYGQIGHLPWQEVGSDVLKLEFGGDLNDSALLQLTDEVKTFTEGTDPHSSQIEGIRSAIRAAERVIYLGFGFHDQNLQLLYGSTPVNTARRSCWGTTFKMSDPNRAAVLRDLHSLEGIQGIRLENEPCAAFVQNNSRSFRFR